MKRSPVGPILSVVIISVEDGEALIKDKGWNVLRGTKEFGWRKSLGDFTVEYYIGRNRK